jgi:UMF1 family MFS transporter
VALFSAAWFAIFALPVLFAVPETPPGPSRRRVSFLGSYALLVADVRSLFARDRNSVWFLIASALYRDGLAAVFSFGAILAVSVYGMAQDTVLIFGIVANVTAALGAVVLGRVEDAIGPKRIIMISLVGLVSTALILLFARGTTMFWIFGLILTLWVGPAQASSRSFLARVAPAGREGEMFGLYATTGRAASFLAPGLFALFSGLFSDRIGIVGIALVLLAGALAMIRVKSPPRQPAEVSEYVV